jgi:AcrR family transcriptional regulator
VSRRPPQGSAVLLVVGGSVVRARGRTPQVDWSGYLRTTEEATMPATRRRPARDRILSAATDLFYERGITATGIDAVVEHAGVARRSLYNNFSSKDELVAAVVDRRHRQWLDLHRARLLQTGDDPVDRVLAVVDAYTDHAEADGDHFRGCGLLNSAAEFPAGSATRAQVARYKQEIEELLRAALTPDESDAAGNTPSADSAAHATAAHLSLLLEGAVTRSGLEGTTAHLHRARALAGEIVHRYHSTGAAA